jgi:hypothetical protein
VVEAITENHKSNQDGKIEKLMNDLANEKANGIQLEEINSKISDLIEANASNTKLQAENENNISNQIGSTTLSISREYCSPLIFKILCYIRTQFTSELS